MWSKGQGVQAADAAIASYQNQIAELRGESNSIAADRKQVEAELQATLFAAASVYLPDATTDTLLRTELELNVPGLKGRRVELERQRQSWLKRLAVIERDPGFVRRSALLHATRGELVLERQQLEQRRAQASEHAKRFEHESLKWLEARTAKKEMQGGLGAFWDTVTFGGYREGKAKNKCCADLGYDSFEALQADLQKTRTTLLAIEARLSELEALRKRVLKLLEEYAQLHSWTTEFEPRACEQLRKELAQRIQGMPLRSLHGSVRPEVRPLIAKAEALTNKLQYLGDMMRGLEAEVADREGRISAIAKTRQSWMLRPRDRISGDKRAWLVTLPAQKHASAHKRVRFTRRMHSNVVEYDDYDDYDHYLGHQRGFLAYDAFAWGADEPMPYEGFSRSVIPEISTYRRHSGHDRPNYDFFKISDRQAAAEARAHAREQERAERAAAREAEREAAREAARAEREAARANEREERSEGRRELTEEQEVALLAAGVAHAAVGPEQMVDSDSTLERDDAGQEEVTGGDDSYAEAEAGLEADSADAGGDSS